jgi:hypothetical protein
VRYLFVFTAMILTGAAGLHADDKDKDKSSDDTPKAAETRKKLQTKITVNFKDTPLKDVIEEIKDEHVKGLTFIYDTGVSKNQAITYSGKDVTLAEAFDAMFKKNGLGYIVISGKKDAYDGSIKIKQGKERGFPITDDKDKPDKDKKDKS